MSDKKELAKTYDPNQVEQPIYHFWQNSGFFKAKIDPDKKPYTIVMPPPNITGQLHMGHALDNTLQDILIRWRRMQGYSALWLPGTDHAAIATEAKIVEDMAKEGLTKESLGREGFLERAWKWKEKYGGRIVEQLKKLGCSCDWSRERFTMDEHCSRAVTEVFVRLYEKGLIYRGERIINWCPKCNTSISDAEVEYEEKEGNLWHIRYPLADQSGYLEVATTRPETMLGDTAVAVNPEDDRYNQLIGKKAILPLVNREIPIIADSYVDKSFGTGAVKITPAHDPNDFEIGIRHNLPIINIMTDQAIINENGGSYAGLDRYQARIKILEDLTKGGYLIKTQPHNHNVGSCYRCSTIVEPRISKQWFVKMKPLAEPAIAAVKNKQTVFLPERFDKIYYHWMENIKDWCISRQLWWGHRIPAYYCSSCGEIIIAKQKPEACKCGSTDLQQDNDTLDTWFSSALWPFSTLGWPDKTEDLEYFYPTDTLVTGYDIIFFWVARMIFSAIEQTGKAPFKTVFIHGIIRDSQGRKMSKSLGNGIDPLEIVEKYGADALRLSLSTGCSPGNDMRFSSEKIEGARNFANKIWNAARFILMNLDDDTDNDLSSSLPHELSIEDKWIISKFNNLCYELNDNLEKFELGLAATKLYDFIWDSFCDWYIEIAKIKLNSDNQSRKSAQNILVYIFSNTLKLLHPFMPFITEKIWLSLPHYGDSIMVSEYPQYKNEFCYPDEERKMEIIMAAIRAIRNRRAEMNVPFHQKSAVYIATEEKELFSSTGILFEKLAYASKVVVDSSFDISAAVQIVTESAVIYIPMSELIDFDKELNRLNKEKQENEKLLGQIEAKLSNQNFVLKAPSTVVESERTKADNIRKILNNLNGSIKEILKLKNSE